MKGVGAVENEECRGYVVRGRVQGVGFRWFTQRTGSALELGGHVRNLADGSVEVHARGSVSALIELEAALRKGPPASRVDEVERIDGDSRTPRDAFEMERWS